MEQTQTHHSIILKNNTYTFTASSAAAILSYLLALNAESSGNKEEAELEQETFKLFKVLIQARFNDIKELREIMADLNINMSPRK